MIEMSEQIGKLAVALHKAQTAMGGAVKDAKNPAFKSKYATLETVIDVAKPALNDAGILFTQSPGHIVDGNLELTTMLIHESGEWMRSTVHVPLPKRDPQGLGSAVTYSRRYSLMSILGIPAEDDDGEAAKGPDWKQEGRDIAQIVNGITDVDALTDFYKTPRVQAYLKNSPNGDALKATFSERKHVLTRQAEAA